MKKLILMICSAALLSASSGCASSSGPRRLVQPDQIKAPALSQWIREPQLKLISMPQLQQILSGSDLREIEQSDALVPVSQNTTH